MDTSITKYLNVTTAHYNIFIVCYWFLLKAISPTTDNLKFKERITFEERSLPGKKTILKRNVVYNCAYRCDSSNVAIMIAILGSDQTTQPSFRVINTRMACRQCYCLIHTPVCDSNLQVGTQRLSILCLTDHTNFSLNWQIPLDQGFQGNV